MVILSLLCFCIAIGPVTQFVVYLSGILETTIDDKPRYHHSLDHIHVFLNAIYEIDWRKEFNTYYEWITEHYTLIHVTLFYCSLCAVLLYLIYTVYVTKASQAGLDDLLQFFEKKHILQEDLDLLNGSHYACVRYNEELAMFNKLLCTEIRGTIDTNKYLEKTIAILKREIET